MDKFVKDIRKCINEVKAEGRLEGVSEPSQVLYWCSCDICLWNSPAMKKVLEGGEVELSNNLSEQMMRSIKMNLKNAGNIGSEESAKHNAFMFSLIESCKMKKRTVEDYLINLLDRLKLSREGDDLSGLLPCNLAT